MLMEQASTQGRHTPPSHEPAPARAERVAIPFLGVRAPVRVVAFAFSLVLHLLLLVVALTLVLQRPAGGQAGSGEIQLAVMTETELDALQQDLPREDADSLPDAAAPEAIDLADIPDPDAVTSGEAETAPTAISGVGESLSSDSGGLDLGALGGGGASFFGVEAVGSRFAYVVDVSGSMTGSRLALLQEQLIGSIEGLLDHASFCIVLYSSDARVVGGRTAWMPATPENKRIASLEIRGLSAGGGTVPLPAFEEVFSLSPRPDAIYFMTDGEFQEETTVIGRIGQMNGSGRTRAPIHCIAFDSQVSERVMQRIAQLSGGSYTYVPGMTQ
jgi:hypothetical protein